MKQFDFAVTIKRPDYKRIDRISLLMCFFAVIIFIYRAVESGSLSILNYLFSAFIIAWCVYNLIQTKKSGFIPRYNIALSAACYGFIVSLRDARPDWFLILLIILYLVASILEKQSKIPVEIGADKNGITINSFPKKTVVWNELNNVIIKDGIVTVDYKSNKLFQKELEEEVTAETEKEFNDFCKLHLNN